MRTRVRAVQGEGDVWSRFGPAWSPYRPWVSLSVAETVVAGQVFPCIKEPDPMHPAGEAVLLGALQGLTEFLPVSSDGHLALAEILFSAKAERLTFNVMLHAGTLLATLLVLRARVAAAATEGVRALARPARFKETPGGRDALVVILASLPTAAIGF